MVKCVNDNYCINQNWNFKQALSHNKQWLTHRNGNTDKIDNGKPLVNDLNDF